MDPLSAYANDLAKEGQLPKEWEKEPIKSPADLFGGHSLETARGIVCLTAASVFKAPLAAGSLFGALSGFFSRFTAPWFEERIAKLKFSNGNDVAIGLLHGAGYYLTPWAASSAAVGAIQFIAKKAGLLNPQWQMRLLPGVQIFTLTMMVETNYMAYSLQMRESKKPFQADQKTDV